MPNTVPGGNLLVGSNSFLTDFNGQPNEEPGNGNHPTNGVMSAYDGQKADRLWCPPQPDSTTGFSVDAAGHAYISGNTYGNFGGHPKTGNMDIFTWKRFVDRDLP